MITLEWGVYFIDAMQKLSEKIRGGVIGTYAVVTKIWMPKWCSLKRERHPGSCGLTKNGLDCKIKKKWEQHGVLWKEDTTLYHVAYKNGLWCELYGVPFVAFYKNNRQMVSFKIKNEYHIIY